MMKEMASMLVEKPRETVSVFDTMYGVDMAKSNSMYEVKAMFNVENYLNCDFMKIWMVPVVNEPEMQMDMSKLNWTKKIKLNYAIKERMIQRAPSLNI